ncbi:hypothetical protein BLSTO_03730 [Blastocystis sp. subtype 1]
MAREVYYDGAELKSDVWSLGITLIELAEGQNPYTGCTALKVMRLVCDGQPPALSSSKWSAAFVDFVNKCLVKDVKERWSVKQLMEHSFVKDSVERIRSAGKSSMIAELADRVGEGRSVPVDNPSEMNVAPDTVIGGKLLVEPVNTAGRVIVRCNKDFLSLDENVEVIEVKNGMCNNEAFEEWSMEEYVRLRELIVGDECFQFVKDLRIVGLNALEKVEIGKECYCKASGGVFEMRDCEKLKSVKIGDGSFVGVMSVVFENLNVLRTISLGDEVFGGELKLVMKNLGELSELTGTMCALKNVKEVELMGMPKLKKCVLMGGLKNVKSVRMENAGKFESVKGLKEVVEAERKRIEEEERKKKEEMIALTKTTVNVRNVGDLKNANCYVGVIVIVSNCCNDSELSVLDLSRFVNLRELKVGDDCFENVKEMGLIGLSQLERVEIGKNCFTKKKNGIGNDPNRHFYVKNCERLKELKIGCYSFSDYSVCVIENAPSLEVIEMGELNEWSWNFYYASLELKNLPSLKSLLFGDDAFHECAHVVFEDLPELTTIQLGEHAFKFKYDESSELIMRNLPKLRTLTSTENSTAFYNPRIITLEDMPSLTNATLNLYMAFREKKTVHTKSVIIPPL